MSFATDVIQGLSARPRSLPSKYFYDERGDALFQAIMGMPEYYLTDCEREIFQACGPDLLTALGNRPFDLVELGAGDGSKTQYLIEAFLAAGANFNYRPIDISSHAIDLLGGLIKRRWPKLPFLPIHDDYFSALDRLGRSSAEHGRLVLFPGANIGNFTPIQAADFLRHLHGFLNSGDLLLIGFDLRKDPDVILAAYNDPAGHTAAFNLNLLRRVNEELGANFNLDAWRHWETYDPASGAARSYLVARGAQTVRIPDAEAPFAFEDAEAIAVEVSQKYSRGEIAQLATATGFLNEAGFEDGRGWFVDALWRV